MMTNWKFWALALVATACALLPLASNGDTGTRQGRSAASQGSIVDGNGNMHVPDNYRQKYQYLGSWAIAADRGQGSKELHVVFASPGTVAAYNAKGHFADGTVLVKEVFDAATENMTTGTVSHSGALKGWFVMVRDTTGRHTGNKLWGDGWGWSWFDAKNPTKTTSTDYKKDCQGCHVPAQANDWIYVNGYPSLKAGAVH